MGRPGTGVAAVGGARPEERAMEPPLAMVTVLGAAQGVETFQRCRTARSVRSTETDALSDQATGRPKRPPQSGSAKKTSRMRGSLSTNSMRGPPGSGGGIP